MGFLQCRSLKTFQRFLDPHFSPSEAYELSIRCFSQFRNNFRLLIQPLVVVIIIIIVIIVNIIVIIIIIIIIIYCLVAATPIVVSRIVQHGLEASISYVHRLSTVYLTFIVCYMRL